MSSKAVFEGKHTPEPWTAIGNQVFIDVGEAQPYVMAQCKSQNADRKIPEASANARRIVACVNACAGIADPGAWREGLFQVRAERNEMLAALKEATDWAMDNASAQPDWYVRARAAIAKAEGRSK